MARTAQVDVAAEEAPLPGEKFVISNQENSELLGLLPNDRTFRFASPTDEERDYAAEGRTLIVLEFNGSPAEGKEHRLLGALTYAEQVIS